MRDNCDYRAANGRAQADVRDATSRPLEGGFPRISYRKSIEPPPNLDPQRLKNQSGGEKVSFRRLYENDTIEKRATATKFLAFNPDDVPNLNWTSKATCDRLRALPYPSLPEGERDLNLPKRLDTKRAQQAMVALLVRYAVASPMPPADIPSVAGLREELRDESLGEAGPWLKTALVRAPEHVGGVVSTAELWEAALVALGNTPDGRAWGTPARHLSPLSPGAQRIGVVNAVAPSQRGGHQGQPLVSRMNGLRTWRNRPGRMKHSSWST